MASKQPSSEIKEEKIDINVAELDFFMGFFNAFRLIKETINKVEGLYYHNYSTNRKIEDIYNTIKAGYKTMDEIQNAMFKAIDERYPNRLDYDVESDSFYLKSEEDVSS